MRFPSESLVPSGGEIYAHIFENSLTGLARDLFWSVTINFAPIRYVDEDWSCGMTCEWIRWPVRDWRELDGKRLNARYGENGIEASFYMTEHHTGKQTSLALSYRRENVFHVCMSMIVNFLGYFGGDEDPALQVAAEADVPFTGIIIIPENLSPKPIGLAEAGSVAAEFIDLSRYDAPAPWNHGYILRPTRQPNS